MVKPSLVATAYHEAGHAVICWRYGVRVSKLTIAPNANSLGSCFTETTIRAKDLNGDSPGARFRLEKNAAILLGGPIAQKHYNPCSFRKHHGSEDYARAYMAAEKLNGSEEAAMAWFGWLEIRTRDQVCASWAVVDRIAKKLLKDETLDELQVRQVIFSAPQQI